MFNIRGREVENSIESIKIYIKELEDRNKLLKTRLDEYNKDTEIKNLKDELKIIKRSSLYIMSELEKDTYKKFVEKHKKCNRGNIELVIINTSISPLILSRCSGCGIDEDITDYSRF